MRHLKSSVDRIIASFKRLPDIDSGQAIVLIALAAVGLIAIIGLAVDGGRLLFLRRDTQNAADAAALAAARALCRGEDYEAIGLSVADINGFSNDGTSNVVEINSPPTNADSSDPCSACLVEAIVKGEIPSTFVGLVYNGPLESTSSTVGVCSSNVMDVNIPELRALWGMSNSCNNTVDFTGSSAYIVGGIHSNNDIHSGATGNGGEIVGPSSYVANGGLRIPNGSKLDWVTDDDDDAAGLNPELQHCGACFAGSEVTEGSYPLTNPFQTSLKTRYPLRHCTCEYAPGGPVAAIAQAKGEYYAYTTCKNSNDAMDMGWIQSQGLLNADGTLKPGIYYSKCNIRLGQGAQGADGLTGRVTLVAQGEIHISGSEQNLSAYINDLLMLTEVGGNKCSAKAIQFSGSQNYWSGNIFAPHGQVSMSGSTNSTTTEGCIVAYTINLSGSSNSVICNAGNTETQPGIWLAPAQ